MIERLPRISILSLAFVLILGAWLRLPFVTKELPYFYNEDEAHHFNRLANMVKTGNFDPQYFHKPSLHFYARIPAFIGSFFYGVSKGQLRTVEEIKTGDPFGLNGYQMSASHPVLAKGNRLFSVMLSLLTIGATFVVASLIFGGPFAPALASALVAFSSGLVSESAVIGVDVLVTLLVSLAILFTLKIEKNSSSWGIFWAAFFAGLAVSTKYNVWPIALLPILGCLIFKRKSAADYALALVVPVLAFFIGSPYTLINLPLFLNHAAYEVWHYKIAGHIGHEALPGLAQAKNYMGWIIQNGIGWFGFVIFVIGSLIALIKPNRKIIIPLAFTVIYFAYMCSQKANFSRNMLPLIPVLASLIAGYLWYFSILIKGNKKRLFLLCLTPFLVLPVAIKGFQTRKEVTLAARDSRDILSEQLFKMPLDKDYAVSGNLNFKPQIYGLKHVSRIDENKTSPVELLLSGFDTAIVGANFAPSNEELKLLHLEKHIPGSKDLSRVVISPEINVYKFAPTALEKVAQVAPLPSMTCQKDESHCWISTKVSKIKIDISGLTATEDAVILPLKIMTPWQGQIISFSIADWSQKFEFLPEQVGKWIDLNIDVPLDKLTIENSLKCEIMKIHSPKTLKLGEETRRLGVAISSEALIKE